jgi:hypothetical protein
MDFLDDDEGLKFNNDFKIGGTKPVESPISKVAAAVTT